MTSERRRCKLAVVGGVGRRYDAGKEAAMIELTEQQVRALENPESTPPRVVNPRTREAFVLLRVDEYERLKPAAAGQEVRPAGGPTGAPATDEWRQAVLETAGKWQGELERPEQGEYERREPLS
jgi:hypothetical protein